MSHESGFSRRGFLASLAAVTAAGALYLVIRRPGPAGEEELVVALTGTISDPKAARAIGTAYLAAASSEASADVLTDAIFAASGWNEIAAADVPERLREQVREDFARGRTFVVLGWTLARTEARLCALVEILARAGRSRGVSP